MILNIVRRFVPLLACLPFVCAPAAVRASPGDFHLSPGAVLATPTGAVDVKVADLDRDGHPDIVAAMPGGTLSVFLNDGHAGFPVRTDSPGGMPVGIDIGDFDGDGWLDVATINSTSGKVTLRLNDRAGHLGPGTDTFVGNPGRSIAGADLDGDGARDLAIVQTAGRVWILRGLGNGTFAPPNLILSLAGQLQGIRAGDGNGDSRIDLAIACSSDRLFFLRNTGSMHFASPTAVPAPQFSTDVEWVDVDQDGDLDLAASTLANIVVIRMNDGLGRFSGFPEYQIGQFSQSVTAADFDGDGSPELLCSSTLDNNFAVLPNLGDGSFGLAVVRPSGAGARSAAVGDFDGDGRPDVVVADEGAATLHILRNHAGAPHPLEFFLPGACDASRWAIPNRPAQTVTADLNGDGVSDLAVACENGPAHVVLRNANGVPSVIEAIAGAGPANSIAVGDLDGDGHPDLVLADRARHVVDLVWNTPRGFESVASLFVDGAPGHVLIADLDGDGHPDVATANDHGPNSAGSVSILFHPGQGFAIEAEQIGPRLDPDPQPIQAISHALIEAGNSRIDLPVGAGPTMLAAGDLDHDGMMDLVVNETGDGAMLILMGLGQRRFAPRRTSYAPGCWTALGDLDGDTLPEIVVADPTEYTLLVFHNLGGGNFAPFTRLGTDRHPVSVAMGDVDANGKPDLAYLCEDGVFGVLMGQLDGSYRRGSDCWAGSGAGTLMLSSGPGGDAQTIATFADDDEVIMRSYTQGGWVTTGCACGIQAASSTETLPKASFALGHPIPNPSLGRSAVSFTVAADGAVTLDVIDIAGRLVRRLVDAPLQAGNHEVAWDGTSAAGARVRAGVYFYRLHSQTGTRVQRAVVLGSASH